MIGLVLVTHGRLAAEFVTAMEHVVGPQQQVATVSIGADDDIEQRRQDIISAVAKVDAGSGVAVLTDMFGGTPSNLAISIMNGAHVEVVGHRVVGGVDARELLVEQVGQCGRVELASDMVGDEELGERHSAPVVEVDAVKLADGADAVAGGSKGLSVGLGSGGGVVLAMTVGGLSRGAGPASLASLGKAWRCTVKPPRCWPTLASGPV